MEHTAQKEKATGEKGPATALKLRTSNSGVMVAGLAVPSMLHESASLRWKAASISLYVQWVFVSVCELV